ncbi:rhodanese-like domain-containing protein [Microbacterium esteraromaticum]|uniref:rhodanese-like domain-containing protein n=1 Tax=Microbacterium esteraromaticum TaxID=57043 RepID=UPI002174FE9A|nr:rhodanese-like domain-containing protein [Microbacterium esteraromaticum]
MRRLTLTTLAVITALTLTSCASTPTPRADLDPDAVIIDVRTPAEHATGHLDGALLLDVTGGDLQAALPDLDPKPPTSSTAVQVTGQESPST